MKIFRDLSIAAVLAVAGTLVSSLAYPQLILGDMTTLSAIFHVIPPASTGAREEFVGPLLGWKRAHADYGCDNTGATDATSCLQTALNGITAANPVLYVECGTYKTTATIDMITSTTPQASVGENVIGQGAPTCAGGPMISWAGSAGGTMFTAGKASSGSPTEFKVSRITFNGNNSANILVDESCGVSGCFDTTVEWSDVTFENGGIGMHCGFHGFGCADVTFIRDVFQTLTTYGIAPGNGNAIDLNAIYSTFNHTNNAANISTPSGINAMGNLFENNAAGDLLMRWPATQVVQGNFSTGSSQFLADGGTLSIPAFAGMFANTAVNLTSTSPLITTPNNTGWAMLGNIIQSPASGAAVPVAVADPNPGAMFSAGNTWTAGSLTSPCSATAPVNGNGGGSCHEFTTGSFPDTVVSRSSITATPPTMPAMPPNNGPGGNNTRQIYEVGTCAAFEGANCHSNATIAAAVTAAIGGGSARPVVHIPAGSVSVGASTITVPACPAAGCDMQIVGDGGQTVVSGSGAAVFKLTGPSAAVIQDMQIIGTSSTDGILVSNADQNGARVFLRQPWFNGLGSNPNINSLNLDGINSATVEVHDILLAGTATNGNAVLMNGTGTLNLFGGASTGNWTLMNLSGGANLYSLGQWNDNDGGGVGGHECSILSATGAGSITLQGMTINLASDTGCSAPIMNFNSYTGNAFITGTAFYGCGNGGVTNCNLTIQGTSTGSNLLLQGSLGPPASTNWITDTSSGAHTTAFLNNAECNGPDNGCNGLYPLLSEFCNPASPCPNINNINTVLGPAVNTRMVLPTTLASGITNVQLYRVFVQGAANGIHIQH